jgi:hypothetical protein
MLAKLLSVGSLDELTEIIGEALPWITSIFKTAIEMIPPWIIRLVEKWLFGWFYLIFSAVSWVFGGGLWRWILNNALFLVGAYYVASILFDFIALWAVERIESVELSRNPAIKDLMMRARYPPYARAIYNKYKGWKVRQVVVGRQPVGGVITKVINFFSAGYWQEIRDSVYKSGLNHALLILVIESEGGEHKIIRIEKNNVVGISDNFGIDGQMKIKNVHGVAKLNLTLEEFLLPVHENLEKLKNYKIMDNNCQGFIDYILDKHGVNSPEIKEYIIQDLTHLNRSLPSFVIPVSDIAMGLMKLWSYIVYLE